MFTEKDLRATLAKIEDDAPIAAEVRPRLRVRTGQTLSLRGLRPVLAGLAAAGTVAAVAVGGAVVLDRPHPAPTHSVPAGRSPARVPLAYDFALSDGSGLTITDRRILPDRQVAHVAVGSKSTGYHAEVTVYAAGAFDPSTLRHGRPVRVNGHPGYVMSRPIASGTDDPHRQVTVGWRFAPDRWATVDGSPDAGPGATDQVVALAGRLRPGTARPALVPFRLSYLPPGAVAESLLVEQTSARVGFGDGHPAARVDPDNTGIGSALTVRLSPSGPTTFIVVVDAKGHRHLVPADVKHAAQLGTRLDIAGHRAYRNAVTGAITMFGHGWVFTVTPTHPDRYSHATLVAVCRGLTPAVGLDDPATWYDATTALP